MMQQTIIAGPAAILPRAAPASPARVCAVAHDALTAPLIADWADAAARSLEPNVFSEPWMVTAAFAWVGGAPAARLALVRDGGGIVIGAMPVTQVARLGRFPLRCTAGWAHPNCFLTSASAVAGRECEFWRMILSDQMLHRGAMVMQIDGLVEGGALHDGLIAAASSLGLPLAVETRSTRAMLATDLATDAYWDSSVRAKKRKELRRQWARLADAGALVTDHLGKEADPQPWIAEFLALEASGWKGGKGSALASNADTHGFFTEAMAAGHARAQVLMTALRIDGRAIAMLITLVSGNAGFSFKTAFDETYARFSPGVLLQRESLGLLSAHRLASIDSCAAQDHPMIDSLWRERRSVVAVSLPLPGRTNRMLWATAQAAKRLWHGLKAWRRAAKPRTASAKGGE